MSHVLEHSVLRRAQRLLVAAGLTLVVVVAGALPAAADGDAESDDGDSVVVEQFVSQSTSRAYPLPPADSKEVVVSSRTSRLPRTGSDTTGLVAAGVGVAVVGAGLVIAGRRMSARAPA